MLLSDKILYIVGHSILEYSQVISRILLPLIVGTLIYLIILLLFPYFPTLIIGYPLFLILNLLITGSYNIGIIALTVKKRLQNPFESFSVPAIIVQESKIFAAFEFLGTVGNDPFKTIDTLSY